MRTCKPRRRARQLAGCVVEKYAAASAGSHRGRAGDRARRNRRGGICQGARGAGAVHRAADAAGRTADGGDRAYRAWRFRPRAGVDLARGARDTIRPGPRTAMSAIAGGRSRRSAGGWTRSSGRRRSPHCRPTGRCDRILRLRGSDVATPRRAWCSSPRRRRGRAGPGSPVVWCLPHEPAAPSPLPPPSRTTRRHRLSPNPRFRRTRYPGSRRS